MLYGGVLIALGHYCLAVPAIPTFYAGLLLIVVGTGLLKPNISAIVGDLYQTDGARRDAGFSIFYMGINLGAIFGPLICSWLGEPRDGATWVNWHYGFAAAGVGMTFALVQYVAGQRHLRGAGELKEDSTQPERIATAWRQFYIGLGILLALCSAGWILSTTGAFTLASFAESVFYVVTALFLLYFAFVIFVVARDHVERQRLTVCFLLCLGAAMFWSGFEQAGSALSLFTRDLTDRTLFGAEITAGALQSVNPILIHSAGTGRRDDVGQTGGTKPLDGRQVRARPRAPRCRFSRDGLGVDVARRRESGHAVARRHLFLPHGGRTLPQSRWLE